MQTAAPLADYNAARKQLTALYQHQLGPIIYKQLGHMYVLAIQAASELPGVHYLEAFKYMLGQIPDWNHADVKEQTDLVRQQCPQLEHSIKGLWGSTLKVIGASRIHTAGGPIRAKVPDFEQVIHQVYICCSKWLDAELFDHNADARVRAKNRRCVFQTIKEAIPGAFCDLLPLDNIFQAYAGDADETEGFKSAVPAPVSREPEPEPERDPNAPVKPSDLPAIKEEAAELKELHTTDAPGEREEDVYASEDEQDDLELPDSPPPPVDED